ncbi:MAG: TorD/DmsD family molecular chaperone [Gammaproteobacteria bacterium]
MRDEAEHSENAARADLYRLLARLLSSPPDDKLLEMLAALAHTAEGGSDPLAAAWRQLADAAGDADAESAAEEFGELFVGLSRGELLPYGSYYRTGFLMEKPLAELRGDLRRLGIERQENVREPEDHIAALCEVMCLLAGEDSAGQRAFFNRHLAGWAGRFFDDLERAQAAQFYRAVGRLGVAFFNLEKIFYG